MKIDTVACDKCGATKQESNHWFLLLLGSVQYTVIPWVPHDAECLDLCGENCLNRAEQEIRDSWNKKGQDTNAVRVQNAYSEGAAGQAETTAASLEAERVVG